LIAPGWQNFGILGNTLAILRVLGVMTIPSQSQKAVIDGIVVQVPLGIVIIGVSSIVDLLKGVQRVHGDDNMVTFD
jgi:hypothetical protein